MNLDQLQRILVSLGRGANKTAEVAGGLLGGAFNAGRNRMYPQPVIQQAQQQIAQNPTAAGTPYPRGYSQQLISDAQKQMQVDKQTNTRSFTSAAGNQYQVPINPEYDKADVKALVKKYFPKNQVENALKVIQAESGGEWWKIGDDYIIPGDISEQQGSPIPSYGLFQIRAFPGRPDMDTLRNPEENIKYAADLFKRRGNSWKDWTTAQEMGLR